MSRTTRTTFLLEALEPRVLLSAVDGAGGGDLPVDGTDLGSLAADVVDAGVVDFVARCFGQGKACEVEFPLTPPDREAVWIGLRVEPLFDSSSEASDFLAIATDLTDQKRAERGALVEVDLSELALRRRGLAQASESELEEAEGRARIEFAKVRRLSLPRGMLGRLLETALVLDRACALEEAGHQVSVREVFAFSLSPRNLGIVARHPR